MKDLRPASFDCDGFYEAIQKTAKHKRLARWEVSQQTGVSVTTLVRLGQGVRPDAASYAALCGWAGINPRTYMTKEKS